MTELWYRNPSVLLRDIYQFFPNKNLSSVEKINSLARFAVYYFILTIIFNKNSEWWSLSVVILLVSLFLGTTEHFKSNDNMERSPDTKCTKPTNNNPFMNYTVGDLIDSNNREPACRYDDVKKEMRKEFRKKVYADPNDMWGKFISDRQFYIMPNTNIVNDQTGFAEACFGKSGMCKSTGTDCLKVGDIQYFSARLQAPNDMLN